MINKENNSSQTYSFETLLEKQGYFVYTNMGFSMLPLLRQKKDIIEIRKKEPGRCNQYDVVLYKRGEKFILHRIVKVLPDGYLISGDNCRVIERDIKDKDILGVMTRVNRNGKDITPDNKLYKLYVLLWCKPYHLRIFYLKIKAFIRRCISFVKRRLPWVKKQAG